MIGGWQESTTNLTLRDMVEATVGQRRPRCSEPWGCGVHLDAGGASVSNCLSELSDAVILRGPTPCHNRCNSHLPSTHRYQSKGAGLHQVKALARDVVEVASVATAVRAFFPRTVGHNSTPGPSMTGILHFNCTRWPSTTASGRRSAGPPL